MCGSSQSKHRAFTGIVKIWRDGLEVVCKIKGSQGNPVKRGQSGEGKQRYKCRNADCSRCTFIRAYAYCGYLPEVKQQIVDMPSTAVELVTQMV